MRWEPHGYQKKGIKFFVQRMAAGLFWDPGLGKTTVAYAAFKALRRAGMVDRMLVVAPLRPATSTWPREALKWDEFRELNVHVLHGENKQELLETPHDVSVINPEGLPWLLGYTDNNEKWVRGAAKSSGVWWDMAVIDESPRFKHTETTRFKVLKPWLPKIARRYLLTGDPAPNGLMDLFGQMYILDYGKSLGQFITRYRNTFFDAKGFGGYTYTIRSGAEKEIYKRIKPYILRMAAEDYLTLPPLIIPDPIVVSLPDKARRVYDQMETLLMAEVDAGIVTASNAASATSKCRQIANGGLYTDAEGSFEHIHDAKTEALQDLVEEMQGKPLLVGYEFHHDLVRLRKAFPKAPFIGGGVSTKKVREIEDLWNAGALPVLLAQPQSAAYGLNLQGTHGHVAFYSVPWDLEIYNQFYKRVWRQGQKERVIVYRFIAEDTIDLAVIRALVRKDKTQRALFDALRETLTERSAARRARRRR